MANSGGRNGSVSIDSSSGGSTVKVHFPAEPGDPNAVPPVPPQADDTDTYINPPDWALRRFEHAMPPLRCNTSVDANGAPSTVGAHE